MKPVARAFLWLCLLTGTAAAQSGPSPYRAVLAAGETDVPVFDHATAAMRDRLLARGTAGVDIQRLSAEAAVIARDGVAAATLDRVLGAIRLARPVPGQTCFVFVTSHGSPDLGLVLAPREEFLTPRALDGALVQGCGEAPTVVIASGCYSGDFVRPPMARPNRIVLTAARANRPSFGCGAGYDFTVYDRCLLTAMDRSATWRDAYAAIRVCVTAAERAEGFRASGPQAWFGAAVKDLSIPRWR